ncbi:hypothetical protein [Amycolatopsis kentuckyensis]|uniref:hypothetical protein n=1 Tax=Amycolatopsis kentuckyensis TaxID=218823 RepID=UPI0035664F16
MSTPSSPDPAADTVCPGCHSGDFPDFDHFVQARAIAPEDVGAAFGAWLNLTAGWDGDQDQVVLGH